ncbi:hypothetical protein C8Q72DRAFT_943339 [Fomitopsis betulina]|nr:hypothetical protein C8Q72DRAFT_943339 [Fomitopsis betulina]
MEYTTTMPSLAVGRDTSPIDDLSYEEMILEYIEDKHIKEYSPLDVEQLATAQKRDTSGVAATGNTSGGFQTVNTELVTTEEASAQPGQLPSILADMETFAEDRERSHKDTSTAFTAIDIQEIHPRIGRAGFSLEAPWAHLVDGILDEFAGLKGLGDYDEDRRDKEIAGKDACVSGGKRFEQRRSVQNRASRPDRRSDSGGASTPRIAAHRLSILVQPAPI